MTNKSESIVPEKRIILSARAGIGNDSTEDITEEFIDSGCKTIDEFVDKEKDSLLEQAATMTSFEWGVYEQ